MSESASHVLLVEALANWVARECSDGSRTMICLDSASPLAVNRPPVVDGHVPDLYLDYCDLYDVVVGEAKTAGDLETGRSERQLCAFLAYCATKERPLFLLAVPWHCVPTARGFLRYLKKRTGTEAVRTVVLEHLPG